MAFAFLLRGFAFELSPCLGGDGSLAVAPTQVALDGGLLFFVGGVVRVAQRELPEGSELALDTVQPRRIGRSEDQPNVVPSGPGDDLGFDMRLEVVQDNVEPFLFRVATTKPTKKAEKVLPRLAPGEAPEQSPCLQVVSCKKVPHATVAMVGRPQSLHPFLSSSQAAAVLGLEIQRSKFVHTYSSASGWPLPIEPTQASVFWPKLRIVRLFPRFGVSPAHLTPAKQKAQPLQADLADDLLLDQILPQFRQRPLRHTDELLRRREGHFRDLLDEVRRERCGTARTMKVRKPLDSCHTSRVEAVNDDSDPLGRVSDPLGDFPVANSSRREENNSCAATVDLIGPPALPAPRPFRNGPSGC